MRLSLLIAACLSLLSVVPPLLPSVWSAETLPRAVADQRLFRAQVESLPSGARVTVLYCRDRPLLRFRSAATSPSLVVQVAGRLQQFYEARNNGQNLEIGKVGQQTAIVAAGQPLLVVSDKEAAANNATVFSLAQTWLRVLKDAFDQPWVWVPRATLALNEESTLTFHTNQTAPLVIGSYDTSLLAIRPGDGPRELRLLGLKAARVSVPVRCGPAGAELRVDILKRAGRILRAPEVILFGTQVPAAQFKRAMWSALTVASQIEPGAELRITGDAPAGTISAAEAGNYTVPVEISGANYLTTRESLNVSVQFYAFPPVSPSALWVSNSPERIQTYRALFEQVLPVYQSVRLLWHHKAAMPSNCDFVIEAINPSDIESTLAINESSAGPDGDGMHAGHVACANYLRQREQGNGYQLTIPARTCHRLLCVTLKPNRITSGVWELVNTGDSDLWIQCKVVPKGFGRDISPAGKFQQPNRGSMHIFPESERTREALHIIGGPVTLISIGEDATKNHDGQTALKGSYGVLHHLNLRIQNPLDVPAEANLFFRASGGAARGVFAVGREWLEVPTCSPHADCPMRTITVAPRSERLLPLLTMPQAGSNYPVRIVVHSLAP